LSGLNRKLLLCALLVFSTSMIVPELSSQEVKPQAKPELLVSAEEITKTWDYYCTEKDSKPSDTWKVVKENGAESNILVCLGKPFGYVRTKKSYKNFILKLEWKYPKDPNGNSGVLIHTVGENKIWPQSIQVQLHGPTAGSIFPAGGAKSANTLNAKNLSLPVNQWNTCVLTCKDGKISAVVNGKMAGEVTGCLPAAGSISLQSEGSEIHFRNITVQPL